jgi:TRAP transporter TAXI family solute receptor
MKPGFSVRSSFLASIILVSLTGCSSDQVSRLVFGSGNPTGNYYATAAAMATYLSREVADLRIEVRPTGGSVENLRRVNRGEIELGYAMSATMATAWAGTEQFEEAGPQRDVRVIARVFTGQGGHHWVALAKSGIQTVHDFAGKVVSVGSPGGGATAQTEKALELLGVYDKIEKVQYLLYKDGLQALKDGHIDVFCAGSAYPQATITDLAATREFNMIGLAPEELERVIQAIPGTEPSVIPAGTYAGMEEDVQQFVTYTVLIAHKDVPADTVYKITRNWFDRKGIEYGASVHPNWARFDPKEALDEPWLLHPGAERYWREIGLTVPEGISSLEE